MTRMPPRRPGVEMIALDPNDDSVTVGKVIVPGAGLRIGIHLAGQFIHMSPAGARRLAKDFDGEKAKFAGIDWIATALRVAADEIEKAPAQ